MKMRKNQNRDDETNQQPRSNHNDGTPNYPDPVMNDDEYFNNDDKWGCGSFLRKKISPTTNKLVTVAVQLNLP